MELDTALPFEIEAHLDDDLISYDSDADRLLETDGLLETDELKKEQGDHLNEVLAESPKGQEAELHNEGVENEEEEELGASSPPKITDAFAEEAQNYGYETPHEIDYDIGDPAGSETKDASPVMAKITTPDSKPFDEQRDAEFLGRSEDQWARDGENEISWEHENEHVQTAARDIDGQRRSIDDVTSATATHELAVKDGIENDHASTSAVELNLQQSDAQVGSIEEAQNEDLFEDVGSDSDSFVSPAITVQYKGDEFPFFSSNSEGFFSNLSVLDEDMKSVMRGFRAELSNELSQQDDLVFLVDDLGLEFSESSSQDLLSSVTLRQMVEVFDILLKNQDPDCHSRPLYTYLFTRANPSRRFDLLMESAAEGKGLSEVESVNHTRVPRSLDTPHAISGEESAAHPQDQVDECDGDSTRPTRDTADAPSSDINASIEVEVSDAVHDVRESHSAGRRSSKDHEDAGNNDSNYEERRVDEVISSAISAAEDENSEEYEAGGDVVVTDALEVAQVVEEVPLKNEAHDLLSLQFEEHEDATSLNGAGIPGLADQISGENADPEVVSGATDDSTTTSTLKDEGNDLHTPGDISEIMTAADDQQNDNTFEDDDIGEIDWQDEPEPEPIIEADEVSSPGATKRARNDDEHAEAGGSSPKRRRP